MPSSLRTALLFAVLLLAACADADAPDNGGLDAPVAVGNPDLLGTWALVEEDGQAPSQSAEVRYRFTDEGDFVRSTGGTEETARFTFASDTRVMIDGPEGTQFLDYEVDGEALLLTESGEEGRTMRFSRLPDERIADVPPPTLEVPVEDALPADGVAEE